MPIFHEYDRFFWDAKKPCEFALANTKNDSCSHKVLGICF